MNTEKLRTKRVIIPAVGVLAAVMIGGTAWAATSNDDVDGSERDRVAEAAVQAVGGTAVDVETSDDPGEAYEVEVELEDGTEVSVALDDDLKIVDVERDGMDDADGRDGEFPGPGPEDGYGPEGDDRPEGDLPEGDRPEGDRPGGHESTGPGAGSHEHGHGPRGDFGRGGDSRDDSRDDDRDDDRALSDSERKAAEKAALAEVGGGKVISVEASDAHGRGEAYEVEVRDAKGTVWEVELDADHQVIGKHQELRDSQD
ncbi:PepSY domain-containing protein [Nocardioides sp. 616]|uniref:PepSY domain-containing protein n=1 Tax=Nocardioides sp. 616 TaxID=2268090 RepID=UPI000CE2F880|nr:PepSY domain-containing protein [Nocardioides sp. 616]